MKKSLPGFINSLSSFFMKKMIGPTKPLFPFFIPLESDIYKEICCQWWDLNRKSLLSEVTTQPTVQQQLQVLSPLCYVNKVTSEPQKPPVQLQSVIFCLELTNIALGSAFASQMALLGIFPTTLSCGLDSMSCQQSCTDPGPFEGQPTD